MIKVSALDFLNKKTFDSDLLDSEGKVLVSAGEEITPEKILKYYFKNTFILDEVPVENSAKGPVLSLDVEETPLETVVESVNMDLEEAPVGVEIAPTSPEMDLDEVIDEEKAPISSDIVAEDAVVKSSEYNDIDMDSDLDSEGKKVAKGPKAVGFNFDDEKTKEQNVHLEESLESEDKISKGPHLSGIDFDEETEDKDSKKKSPVASKFDFDDAPAESKPELDYTLVDLQVEAKEKPPDKTFLTFDEEQAERIAQKSVKIGEILKFGPEDLKKLRQSAYYCNIGLQKFQKEDYKKKNFEKLKAYASYQIVTEEMNLPSDIAETIKNHADDYDPLAFPLNTQIPRQHIVGIVSYYENKLMQNRTKQEVIEKMLQLGGNKFNIFVLHKFITMMRESNE